jgi:hypothetical protein
MKNHILAFLLLFGGANMDLGQSNNLAASVATVDWGNDVDIPTVLNANPTISSAAGANSVTVSGANASLTITLGSTLTTGGDLNVSGTSASVSNSGAISLGSLILEGAATIANAGTINVAGSITNSSGVVVVIPGDVIMNGTGVVAQSTISGDVSFTNFTNNSSQIAGNLIVSNNITVGGIFANNQDVDITGNLTVGAEASINNIAAITIAGDLINSSAGELTIANVVTFAGGVSSNITTAALNFTGTMTNTDGLTSDQNITVTGTFDNDGVADLSGNLTLNGGSSTFDNDGGTLNFSGTTFTCADDATIEGTVIFDGTEGSFTGNGTSVSFATLTIADLEDAGQTVIFNEPVTVGTLLTVDALQTADFNDALTISVGFINNGTTNLFKTFDVPVILTTIAGTVVFDGISAQTVDSDISSFFNLTNDNQAGLNRTIGALEISGLFDNNRTFDCDQNLTITGSIDNTAGSLNFAGVSLITTDLAIEGSVLFNGTTSSISNGIQFTNVRFDGVATTLPATVGVLGGFDFDAGILTLTGSTVIFSGGGDKSMAGDLNPEFTNLVISGASTVVTVSNTPTISGTLTVDDASGSIEFENALDLSVVPPTFNNIGTITFTAGVSNAGNATVDFDDNSGSIELGGTYTDLGASTIHNFNNLTFLAGASYATLGVLTVNGVFDTETNSGLVTLLDGGILMQDVGADNTAAIVGIERVGNNHKREYTYWGMPVEGVTGLEAFPNSNLDDFYAFNAAIQSWERQTGTTIMQKGVGYIVTPSPNLEGGSDLPETFTFDGRPHNGNAATPVNNLDNTGIPVIGGEGWNLIANPYPSPINIATYLLDNLGVVSNVVYTWDSEFGSNADNGAYTARLSGYIGVGQSFMTSATVTDNVSFNNDQRETVSNPFYRIAAQPEIDFSIVNDAGFTDHMKVYFPEDSHEGYDPFWDAPKLKYSAVMSFYTRLNVDANSAKEAFVFQGIGSLDVSKTVPIGIDAYEGLNLSLKIDSLSGIDPAVKILLHDKKLNVQHDLRAGPYNFTLDSVGEHTQRLELVFIPSAVCIIESNEIIDFVICQAQGGLVLGGFENEYPSDARLIDVSGRVLQSWKCIGEQREYLLSLPEIMVGMYFVQVITEAGKTGVRKIILH